MEYCTFTFKVHYINKKIKSDVAPYRESISMKKASGNLWWNIFPEPQVATIISK